MPTSFQGFTHKEHSFQSHQTTHEKSLQDAHARYPLTQDTHSLQIPNHTRYTLTQDTHQLIQDPLSLKMPTVSTLTFVKTKETNRETFLCVDLEKQEKEVDWYYKN